MQAVTRPAGWQETGVASWYGEPYHGRRTSNGETYDMHQMTAAHRSLPFGTWIRVHNLDNGRTTEVRITDRGPFVEGRIVDLSRASAEEIGMIGPGTANVRLEIIPPREPETGRYVVQVGVFADPANAERLRAAMEARYGNARMEPRPGNPAQWRVLVGAPATREAADALAERIRREDAPDAVVVVP